MPTILITALLLVLHGTSAVSIPSFQRSHGSCKQLDIPVFVTSGSAVYQYPRVDNDIEATAWAIYSDTRSTPAGAQTIIKNTTTSGTFIIHAQLCVPNSSKNKQNTLQIATHGAHCDSRYWDPELDREKQSYVEAALRAGYSILTYDRLGAGQSDKPDAYNVVQAPLELEILRQLTLMARNNTLYTFARKAKPADPAFNTLTKPSKVVHIGHSFGSLLTSAFIAMYSDLTDGAIITGFLPNKYFGKVGIAAFAVKYAGSPPFNRPSGYVVCQKSGIQTTFFAGDPNTAFTKEMLDYSDAVKQPIPIGEFASAYHLLGLKGPSLKAPVQYMLAEFDFYVCAGDCNGLPEADPKALAETYPNAVVIDVVIQPNTGHAFTLHNNATAGYQAMFNFLARNKL